MSEALSEQQEEMSEFTLGILNAPITDIIDISDRALREAPDAVELPQPPVLTTEDVVAWSKHADAWRLKNVVSSVSGQSHDGQQLVERTEALLRGISLAYQARLIDDLNSQLLYDSTPFRGIEPLAIEYLKDMGWLLPQFRISTYGSLANRDCVFSELGQAHALENSQLMVVSKIPRLLAYRAGSVDSSDVRDLPTGRLRVRSLPILRALPSHSRTFGVRLGRLNQAKKHTDHYSYVWKLD